MLSATASTTLRAACGSAISCLSRTSSIKHTSCAPAVFARSSQTETHSKSMYREFIEIEKIAQPAMEPGHAMKIELKADEPILGYQDTKISEILEHKKEVHSIHEKATVFEAIKKMTEKKIGALIVVNDLGGLVGVITERDYLNKVAIRGFSSKQMLVDAIMVPRPYFISPDFTARTCLDIMTNRRFRHLPVCSRDDYIRAKLGYEKDAQKTEKMQKQIDVMNPMKPARASGDKIMPLGIISIGDCVKAVIEEQQYSLRILKEYATDRAYSGPKE